MIAIGGEVAVIEEGSSSEPEAARAPEPEPEPEPEPAQAAAPAPEPEPAPVTAPAPTPEAPAPEAPAVPDGSGTREAMPRMRRVIAQRMTESLRTSAQLTAVQRVDLSRIVQLREREKEAFARREGVKLTYLPFFAKAAVEALQEFPHFNASLNAEGTEIVRHEQVHLAVAVDTPRGLLVPVIRDVADLGIAELARRIADVAERTRDRRIGAEELNGGTFTITNIGTVGSLFDTPIINQPQVAILATGVVTREPVVVTGPSGEEAIGIRPVCHLPLTYDHRLVDGADAGRFLGRIRERLERGAFEDQFPS